MLPIQYSPATDAVSTLFVGGLDLPVKEGGAGVLLQRRYEQ